MPPRSFIGAQSFYENVRQFKHTHDLLLFSESDWPEINIKLRISPEVPFTVIEQTKPVLRLPQKFAINNILWFTSLKMARDAGYSHVLYLESDCRVGRDDWDAVIFDEYFGMGRALICGGSLGVYNPANWNRKATDRWCELVARHFIRKNMPIPSYGWKGANEKHPVCVFPNGAISIISVAWAHELFDLTQPATKLAVNPEPFDMALGRRLWEKFEEDTYEVVGHLTSSYSTYGDIITSLDERKEMLTSGKIVAGHHYKDSWKP